MRSIDVHDEDEYAMNVNVAKRESLPVTRAASIGNMDSFLTDSYYQSRDDPTKIEQNYIISTKFLMGKDFNEEIDETNKD